MRIFAVLAVAAVMVSSPAFGKKPADEFGSRFYGKAPSALGDYTAPVEKLDNIALDENAIAEGLQKIEPAGGEAVPAAPEAQPEKEDKKR